MSQQTKSYISKLEKLFVESLQVENRKQLKALLTKLSRINVELTLDALPCIENLPTSDSVDEIPEGSLKEMANQVGIEITNTEEALDNM